ncbi:hypothetical protein [Hugenholtzia roseola]|uniref:hypothetical protein n=1 Tax=Hugenholtzia roseola TaxID=1002 RepID=UPI000408E780|nr:hypothetical protein [Hugenholtzia roseola]
MSTIKTNLKNVPSNTKNAAQNAAANSLLAYVYGEVSEQKAEQIRIELLQEESLSQEFFEMIEMKKQLDACTEKQLKQMPAPSAGVVERILQYAKSQQRQSQLLSNFGETAAS